MDVMILRSSLVSSRGSLRAAARLSVSVLFGRADKCQLWTVIILTIILVIMVILVIYV